MLTSERFIGSGRCLIDVWASGAKTNKYLDVARVEEIIFGAPGVEKLEKESRQPEDYGQVVDSITKKIDQAATIKISSINKDNLILAMYGGSAAFAQTGGSATSEALTAAHDKHVRLQYRNISNVVVKDVTDTTTYVLGTDYEINDRLGTIKALSTGSIGDSDVLHVSYDYGTISNGYTIQSNQVTKIEATILADIKDQNNPSREGEIIIHKCEITPAGDRSFLSDNFIDFDLEVKILSDGTNPPYEVKFGEV